MSAVATGLAARIGGVDVVGTRSRTDVVDPADLSVVATVGSANRAMVARAVDVAHETWPLWAATSGPERATILRSVASDLRADTEPLATTITAETGKRLAEARAEVELSARYLDWFADVAESPADAVPGGSTAQVGLVPAGVAVAVTTWNFPLSIPVRKLAAALAAGCTVVLKPSPLAPVTGVELVRRFERQLPAGVVGLVLGGTAQVRGLVQAEAVRAVSFTGSTEAGIDLARRLAGRLTRSVLELGGRAPVIVRPDASVEEAVDTLMVAKFRNNGASCIAANNVFVHADVAAPVLDALEDRVRLMVPADPRTEESNVLGPMRTAPQARAIEGMAAQAEARGCRVARGALPTADSDCFTRPVLVHAEHPIEAWEREVFGPLLQVRCYRDEDDVVREVNGWRRGLGGYVVGTDRDRARELARRLRIGIVGIGTGTPNSPELPFGGFDLAGWGREGSVVGMDPFVERQAIVFG